MRKTRIISSLVIIVLVMVLFAGCEKGEKAMTNTLSGTWKVTKYNNGEMNTPIIRVFGKDGYYKVTTTILEKDIVYEGTWEWINDAEVLRIILGANNEDFTVVDLDGSRFTYKDGSGALWEMEKQ